MMDRDRYYLDENKNVMKRPKDTSYAQLMVDFEEGNRRVATTFLFGNTVRVSTVFLAFDHGFGGTPMFFETMIFCDTIDWEPQWRYSTWDEAVKGHENAIRETIRRFCPYGVLPTFETEEISK
jgi:hypothetical protein